MKNLPQEYRDYVTYNHAITASPRVRAEWNWNHTSKLALEHRNGVYAKLYVMPTGGWNPPAGVAGKWTAIGEGWTTAQKSEAFNMIFNSPVRKTFIHSTPTFTYYTNKPNLYWMNNGVEVLQIHNFGMDMTFQFEAKESGTYQFYSTSDDAHEWYITDSNGVEQLLTKYHGARQAVAYPSFSENTTFTLTPGKYNMRFKVYEGNIAYDFSIGFRSPSQITAGNTTIQRIDGDAAILPGEMGPKHNPEPYTPVNSTQGVTEWKQDREYFPMESIIDPNRPLSGIRYNILPGDAYIMAPADYITTYDDAYVTGVVRGDYLAGASYAVNDIVKWDDRDYSCITSHTAGPFIDFAKFRLIGRKPNRYYMLHRADQKYKYWISDTKSDTGQTGGVYEIDDAGFVIYYTEPVGTNKVTVTFNLGAQPKKLSVDYYGWLPGQDVNADIPDWHPILQSTDTPQLNPYTGQLQFWIDANLNWTQIPTESVADNSVKLERLRVNVLGLNKASARIEVIEASARKVLDISHRVVDFSITRSMDEQDFMRLIGEVSANSGAITISDWDNAFELDTGTEQQKLEQLRMRKTKFTFDLIYDLESTGYGPRYYATRLATLHSADWSRDGEFDYSINLFDSAKLLMNLDSVEFFEHPGMIHVIVAQLLDLVGFDRYQFDKADYDPILNSTSIDYYSPSAEMTVWEALQEVAETTLCAIFFDEYDQLQIMTKEEITAATLADVQIPISLDDPRLRKVPLSDYVLRGHQDDALIAPFADDPGYDIEALPNIIGLNKDYDVQANKVKITYNPKSIKMGGDLSDLQPQTDIVWKEDETVVLRATRLVKPLPAQSVYSEPDNDTMFFWITSGKEAELWPFKGKANVNGEIIEWDGKEYFWMEQHETNNGVFAPTYTYSYHNEIIFSEEDWRNRIAKAKNGNWRAVNGFTGKIRLKVDTKKKKVTGRGADMSKYQVDHPTGPRQGWSNVRLTLGDQGVWPGYWPGEQNSSFYITQNDPKNTSIEINRPTNANDDWFKTQALMRRDSVPGIPLQQWGFRFKFKESATMGEISIMFNMATAAGGNWGSQAATDLIPGTFNQWYQVSFLETQGIVRNAAHEIAAWVQSPDPFYRTQDNAIRGSASRMYTRNYHDSWEERMKGYRFNFERNKWYDVKIDLTRGRGYSPNQDMHFFVWVNGIPAGGFNAAGPPTQHLWLPPTNTWAIGSRAASKVEIENAYSWTEFDDLIQQEEMTRYDLTNGQYAGAWLDEGLLLPAKGKNFPYRDGSEMGGYFFFDDFGGSLHEIREYKVELDKAPVEGLSWYISNENVRMLDIKYSPNEANFAIVNASGQDQIAQGEQNTGQNNNVNHQMILYGYVLTEDEETTVERENKDSIRDRGEVRLEIDANWINTKYQAEDLAAWIVDHFSNPMDVLDVEVFGDTSYSIGDKVRIFYKKAQIDPDWLYIISEINYDYNSNGLESSITLRRVRNNETDGIITID